MKTGRHDPNVPVPEWLLKLAEDRRSSTQTEAQKAEWLRVYERHVAELDDRIRELRIFGRRAGLR